VASGTAVALLTIASARLRC